MTNETEDPYVEIMIRIHESTWDLLKREAEVYGHTVGTLLELCYIQ